MSEVVLDFLGYATFRRWGVHGEEGLSGREAALWPAAGRLCKLHEQRHRSTVEGLNMQKPYLGMLGYTAEGRPFMELDVDRHDAKERARENDLSEYILVPRGENEHDHLSYIRNQAGDYKKKTTRLAVFRHLLSAGVGEVPSRKDVGLD